jgi:Lipocalin-like domain
MNALGAAGWGLAAVVIGLLAPPFARAQTADDMVRKQLAGEWTLVKYEVFPENGQARSGNYDVGRINYGEREMSAHLMRTERPSEPQNYLGYFGPYTVDADKKVVIHHVVGSSLRTWIGSDQVRHYGFSEDGNQLTLSLKSGDRITQTLTWTRTKQP